VIEAARKSPADEHQHDSAELLLRETVHRCSNDLQLVVGLLSLQARRTRITEARTALQDAANRVAVLARSRAASLRNGHSTLGTALRQVCEALHAHAEPRSILLSLEIGEGCDDLDPTRTAAVALAVNELATNAIKHAFDDERGGHIRISARCEGDSVVVTVDDDGLPLPEAELSAGGLGLGLIRRVIASRGGALHLPSSSSKTFAIMMPGVR
jgi:two-component sensor histidine kinase